MNPPPYLLRTMCGDLQKEMAENGMFEYRSGLLLNHCIQASSFSLPMTQSVYYLSDSSDCSAYTLRYFNDSSCSPANLFREDPAQVMDGISCVGDSYIFTCTTLDLIDVNDYSGIIQYGYEDNSCSSVTYFMQYGCSTDGETCISLQPFGARDSAQIVCSEMNGTTIHYGGNYNCSGEPVISSTPVDTCDPYTPGIDDMFSQGSVFFTGTETRKIVCSHSNKKDESSNGHTIGMIVLVCVLGFVLFVSIAGGFFYFRKKTQNGKKQQLVIETSVNNPL